MIKAGILGTGNIGIDLLYKLIKTKGIDPIVFSGRRSDSPGIRIAKNLGIQTTTMGIDFFEKNKNYCDVVFECTNAIDAKKHFKVFNNQNIRVVDLTPAKLGPFCVPSINSMSNESNNINMITCGGQASIPLLNIISKFCAGLEYIEVVSQISSDSAGMATRLNIDNYIETTENAIKQFTDVNKCKVILNLNPAIPQVDMQTTIFIKAEEYNFEDLLKNIYKRIKELKRYIPFYELIMPPVIQSDILVLSVKVKGAGDYLPEYAGNLDIINCAAIEATIRYYEK